MEETKEARLGAGEAPVRKRQITLADRTASQPTGGTRRAPLSLGELLRHSLVESSMLERHVGYSTPCAWCHHSHRGPCLETNLAPRPKSLFVCSSASSSPASSEEWLAIASSRRASIDTSELGDSNYTCNIRGLPLEFGADKLKLDDGEKVKSIEQHPTAARIKNVDGGYAWVILAVVFLINASILGSHRAYGLIYNKLARESGQTRTQAAFPFSLMGVIENMAGPLCGCLLALTGSWRVTILLGTTLVTAGHLAAAFWAHSQLGHVLSMGLITGFGLSFMSISFFQVNKAYFDRYRCIATGVGLSGAAFGTLIISRVCQHFLDHYEGTRMCYLALGAFMAPNIPLALLLRPLGPPSKPDQSPSEASSVSTSESSLESIGIGSTGSPSSPPPAQPVAEIDRKPPPPRQQVLDHCEVQIASSTPGQVEASSSSSSAWSWIKPVIANPYFHLIWPTQLLYSWFNFTFSMIMIDFAKDRRMGDENLTNMVPAWAFGQLFGRLVLSCLVDLKYISDKAFTITCFLAIGAISLMLNQTRTDAAITCPQYYRDIVIVALMFTMSMFIALLCILINNLVVNYVQSAPLQPISLGLSSFAGSFFLLPRANVIGHYRDTFGNYDALLMMLTYVALLAGLLWLILPLGCVYMKSLLSSGARVTERKRPLPGGNNGEIVKRSNMTTGASIPVEELLSGAGKCGPHSEPPNLIIEST